MLIIIVLFANPQYKEGRKWIHQERQVLFEKNLASYSIKVIG